MRSHLTLPQISVVVTYFRKGNLLLDALQSAIWQLDLHDELIVVDDCSRDGIAERIFKETTAAVRSKCSFLETPTNVGSAAAKNIGINASEKDIICFLDADDILPDGALAAIRTAFALAPEADFVYGDYVRTEEGQPQIVSCANVTDEAGWLDVSAHFKQWRVLGSSPFRRSVVDRIGPLNEAMPRTDDIDWQTLAMANNLRFRYAPAIIYVWNRHVNGNNNSRTVVDNFRSAVFRTPLIIRASKHGPRIIVRSYVYVIMQLLPNSLQTLLKEIFSWSTK